MPASGPRKPIQRTDVPVKVKVACTPAVAEYPAAPPLHCDDEQRAQPAVYATDGSVSSKCDTGVWGDDDVTSNASTTIVISVDAALVRPVTSIVNVWRAAARSFAVKTTTWGSGAGANRSTSPTSTPSSTTRAIPAWGPR